LFGILHIPVNTFSRGRICSPRTKTSIKPMSKTNVGANFMFALRKKTAIKPMFENELETFASDIGSQTIVVRRANIRFAPTLFSDIDWILITSIYPKTYDRLLTLYFLGILHFHFNKAIINHLNHLNQGNPGSDNENELCSTIRWIRPIFILNPELCTNLLMLD